MSKLKNSLIRSIQEYLEEYPKRKLNVDVNSETLLYLWNEFNFKGFHHIMMKGPVAKETDNFIEANNTVVKLLQSLKQTELTKINFHFGNNKNDTVIVSNKMLLELIKSVLVKGIPEREKVRRKVYSITSFIDDSFSIIQQLKEHGMNNDFIAFYLGIDVEAIKKGIREVKKRRGQTHMDLR